MGSVAAARSVPVRPVLLSLEPWDQVWRRNQQLASRIPGTVFVEPSPPGVRTRRRTVDGVTVVTTPKPLPFRWPAGRWLHARLAARALRRITAGAPLVTWATHAYHQPVTRAINAPVVYDRTDDWPAMETDPAAREAVRRLDAALVRSANVVVVVSEGMRGQTRPDAQLVPNGVDLTAFRAATPRPHGDTLRAGYVGSLDPIRIDYAVLEEIARVPGLDLVVAGPGTPPAGATSLGIIDHAAVPELLLGCDLLVAPYRTDEPANRTSDALKLYEYFATGLPVVATATAGFERYPDLVIPWPVPGTLREACVAQQANAERRRAVARGADWSARAAVMSGLIRALVPGE